MANVKITDLPAGSALGGTELFESVQSSASVKTTADQIKTFVGQSLTVSNAVGSFDSITITAGAVPFNTITNRAYASFASLRDQTATSAAVSYAAEFDTAATFNTGITVASSSNITFAAAGVYECSFSAQVDNTDSNDHDVTFWYSLNGADVANSGSRVTVPKAADGGKIVFEFNFQEKVTAGQYIQVRYAVENTALKLDYTAASAPYPGIPSIFFIANRIG